MTCDVALTVKMHCLTKIHGAMLLNGLSRKGTELNVLLQ